MGKNNGAPKLIPAFVWGVLGAVAAAAIISLCLAIWVQLPVRPATKPTDTAQRPMLPLDLPPLPAATVPTELPPSQEVTATVPLPLVPPVKLVVAVTPTAAISPATPLAAISPYPYPKGAGQLVLVVDDMGMDPANSGRALAVLPKNTALAFLVEGAATTELAAQAKAADHPVLLHLPMEPQAHTEATPPLGPYGLTVGMSSATIAAVVAKNLAQLPQAEGMNNHMGSRFTQWQAGMAEVLSAAAAANLYFLDSKTAAPTATKAAAAGLNIKLAARDVFLDHTPTPAAVRAELLRAVKLAQKRHANNMPPVVVIGHPLPVTLDVLASDLPLVEAAGVKLVPVTSALAR